MFKFLQDDDNLSRMSGMCAVLIFASSLSLVELPKVENAKNVGTASLSFSVVTLPKSVEAVADVKEHPSALEADKLRNFSAATNEALKLRAQPKAVTAKNKMPITKAEKRRANLKQSQAQKQDAKRLGKASTVKDKRYAGRDNLQDTEPSPKSAKRMTASPKSIQNAAISAQEFAARISSRIKSELEYPNRARRRGVEGTAVLRFSLKNGRLVGFKLATSSGSALLDEAAANAADKVMKSEATSSAAIDFLLVPVSFKLTD